MSKERAPLFEQLAKHARSGAASFHVPGHKFGQTVDAAAASYYASILAIDATEISGLDNLHDPQGVIAEAERLAAQCFGAEDTYFLVGGSTVGNLALLLAVCGRGDLILVQRNVHRSVIHGLMLAGARAVFLAPVADPRNPLGDGLTAEVVAGALKAYPEAKAVLITNPTYYGCTADVRAIAEAVHRYDKPLLVDEAHGAHFGFHPLLPESALACGADGVVQSTHKMLTAMTMGSMLHVQHHRISRALLRQRLAILQSSSPSYPIMASLDLCRRWLDTSGRAALHRSLMARKRWDRSISSRLHCFTLLHHTLNQGTENGRLRHDPYKIVLQDNTGTLNGYELARQLENNGCFPEMSDMLQCVLTIGPGFTETDGQRLLLALESIASEYGLLDKPPRYMALQRHWHASPAACSTPVHFDLEMDKEDSVMVPLESAAGYRSAEMIVPYPPGVPVLYPNETITEQAINYMQQLVVSGASILGATDPELKQIRVLAGRKEGRYEA